MKNVYIGDAIISLEIIRNYEDLFEEMLGGFRINEDEGVLTILLYEDFRIPNNPFSDVTKFPLNVTFSFSKLIQEEDFMYNLWEINISFNVIERITEEYEDDMPGHEYNILFKDGSRIEVIGECCWSTIDGSSYIFDPEIHEVYHSQCDVYNKVHITCEITEKDVLINYLKNRIESQTNYLERLTNPIRKVASIQKIAEIRKRLNELESGE